MGAFAGLHFDIICIYFTFSLSTYFSLVFGIGTWFFLCSRFLLLYVHIWLLYSTLSSMPYFICIHVVYRTPLGGLPVRPALHTVSLSPFARTAYTCASSCMRHTFYPSFSCTPHLLLFSSYMLTQFAYLVTCVFY